MFLKPKNSNTKARASVSLSAHTVGIRAAHKVAKAICDFVPTEDKPYFVLGLATGSTPEGMYAELIRLQNEGMPDGRTLSFKNVVTFNLDEYVGLPENHPQSYHSYMHEKLFMHLNPPPAHIFIPNGNTDDVEKACVDYETNIVKFGGIDLQVLGIGENGHIGFMEPWSPFNSRTQFVELTESTREANKRFFDGNKDKTPTHAVSMGLETIAQAKEIIVLATGAKKGPAVRDALLDHANQYVPASILQTHPNTTFFIDREASKASNLSLDSSMRR